jgi:hypothetical protein
VIQNTIEVETCVRRREHVFSKCLVSGFTHLIGLDIVSETSTRESSHCTDAYASSVTLCYTLSKTSCRMRH